MKIIYINRTALIKKIIEAGESEKVINILKHIYSIKLNNKYLEIRLIDGEM